MLDGKSVKRAVDALSYVLECKKQKTADRSQKTEDEKIRRYEVKQQQTTNYKQLTKNDRRQDRIEDDRVSFIVPSGNDQEALLSTLTSLSQNVKHPDWEVVIVINNEGIRGMLADMSGDVRIVEAEGNNLALLYNKGADASSGEYLIFMRPGIVYFKNEGLIHAMKDGVTGIPIKNSDMTPYCLGIGFDFNFTPYRILTENGSQESGDRRQKTERDAVGGGFIAMSREVFESVGDFDEEIANHLIEPDICLMAKELSIHIKYLSNSLAFNYKETFFREDVSDKNWKNRIRFFAKWVGKLPKDEDFIKFAGDLLKV